MTPRYTPPTGGVRGEGQLQLPTTITTTTTTTRTTTTIATADYGNCNAYLKQAYASKEVPAGDGIS